MVIGASGGTGDEDEATQLCRQALAFAAQLYLPAIHLEGNGIGKFLPGLLRREIKRQGRRIAVVEAQSKRAKESRIIDAFDAEIGRAHV